MTATLTQRATAAAAVAVDNDKPATRRRVQKKEKYEAPSDGSMTFTVLDTLPFYAAFIYPLLTIGGAQVGLNWLAVWGAFSVLPLLDTFSKPDTKNPTEDQRHEHEEDFIFKLPLFLYVPAQLVVTVFAVLVLSSDAAAALLVSEAGVAALAASRWQQVGLLLSAGVCAGNGINVAHELFHKRERLERVLGSALLLLANYMHFRLEHVSGHHKWVATPEDPASAEQGITVYRFYVRSVVGSYVSSWNIEKRRLERAGCRSVWTARNQMLWFAALPAVAAVVLSFAAGTWKAGAAFYAIGWVAHTLLEVINYVEHYGLRREKLADGTYEPVNILHSWNAPDRYANYVLFKLERHSDHHANALRRYQFLRSMPASPHMVASYPACILMALVPAFWFKIMDPLVTAYNSVRPEDRSTHNITLQEPKGVKEFVVAVFVVVTLITFCV